MEISFYEHMKQIANFCLKEFNKNWKLDTTFIKKLHRIHYPDGYIRRKKTLSWETEFVSFRPWVYKYYENYPWVKPKDVKKEMKKLVNNYNKNINGTHNKFQFITEFIIAFFKIHPFWDSNWAVASILYDLLLLKNNLAPVYLKWFYLDKTKKQQIYNSIEQSIKMNKSDIFSNLILKLHYDKRIKGKDKRGRYPF
jgi:Fic family protein